ncbi:MAG: lysophospholipase [Gammaproteobacteria bacterium]|nr:lysophospholipase [Gammaproteobacteria bacterium]
MKYQVDSVQWQDADDGAKHATREFIFSTEQGRLCTGAIWHPLENASSALIAFGHGASGDRYQAPIPYLAGKFVREGHTVLSIDGPVHGLRQVGPGGREAFGEEMRRETMIDDMNADWRFAIDLAKSETTTELTEIAYFGLSMGSIFGIPMLADPTRGLPVTVATLGLLGSQGVGRRLGSRVVNDAEKILCPLLFLMQLEDELFSRDGYLELFDAFGSNDKRIHANPGLHPEVPTAEMRFAFEFMRSRLGS